MMKQKANQLVHLNRSIIHYFVKTVMASENGKTRSKAFSQDEVMALVDLLDVNRSRLFGALSATLTMDEKNKVWQDIARKLSEQHGQMRTRYDVSKKWYNLLSKHKPRIADKIASARRTGGVQQMPSFMSSN